MHFKALCFDNITIRILKTSTQRTLLADYHRILKHREDRYGYIITCGMEVAR